MAIPKTKLAFTIFFVSFALWMATVYFSVFQSGQVGRIQFPNASVQALFLGSSATSVISCFLIGLSFLKIKIGREKATLQKQSSPKIRIQTNQALIHEEFNTGNSSGKETSADLQIFVTPELEQEPEIIATCPDNRQDSE